MNFQSFLKFLLNLIRLPIISLVRLVILIIVIIPVLLSRLCKKFKKCLYKRSLKEQEGKEDCHKPFPEEIMRRPDPCIYSQTYLAEQGLPVTWDNPDIWLTKGTDPAIVSSGDLLENTEYIAHLKVHNASTDPAIGVKVRLHYKSWSFNIPSFHVVQTDANGVEISKIANIPPMGFTMVRFIWRTPTVEEDREHFCLQVILSHPLDTNTANNIGYENTSVRNVGPGESARIVVPLYNNLERDQVFVINAIQYDIKEENIQLRLKKNIGRPKFNYSKMGLLVPSINLGLKQVTKPSSIIEKAGLSWNLNKYILKTKYTGLDDYKKQLIQGDYKLPPGMEIEIEGYMNEITLAKGTMVPLVINIKPPPTAKAGDRFPITFIAKYKNGQTVGGVTVLITIK